VLLVVAGTLIVIAGLVWTLQGVGDIGGSFMSGNTVWAIIGPAVVVAGLVVAGFGLLRRHPGGRA
jgi:hypothetical protein